MSKSEHHKHLIFNDEHLKDLFLYIDEHYRSADKRFAAYANSKKQKGLSSIKNENFDEARMNYADLMAHSRLYPKLASIVHYKSYQIEHSMSNERDEDFSSYDMHNKNKLSNLFKAYILDNQNCEIFNDLVYTVENLSRIVATDLRLRMLPLDQHEIETMRSTHRMIGNKEYMNKIYSVDDKICSKLNQHDDHLDFEASEMLANIYYTIGHTDLVTITKSWADTLSKDSDSSKQVHMLASYFRSYLLDEKQCDLLVDLGTYFSFSSPEIGYQLFINAFDSCSKFEENNIVHKAKAFIDKDFIKLQDSISQVLLDSDANPITLTVGEEMFHNLTNIEIDLSSLTGSYNWI